MASWVLSWLVVPIVVIALSAGLGLLAERVTRSRLDGPVVLAIGASVLVVGAALLTGCPATASLSGPVLVLLSVAGWLFARPSVLSRGRAWWPVVTATAVYACYAAPVALSGSPTWGGFVKLDDTPDWMALGERLATVGNSTKELAHSTYGVLMQELLGGGYPLGAFADLGVVSRLVGQDTAFVIQPLMATLAAILGCALYAVTDGMVRRPGSRAAIAFVASTSTLLLGYTLWGGIKEVTLSFLLATCCAVMTQRRDDSRALLGQAALYAIPMAGVFAVFGIAGGVYLAPMALVEVVLLWRWYGLRHLLPAAAVFTVVFAVLSVPSLKILGVQVSGAASGGLRTSQDLGNLFAPLRFEQILGVWPTGDFRAVPSAMSLTWLLVALVAGGAIAGVVLAIGRGLPALPVLVLTNLAVSVYYVFGNPWLEGKALAAASPSMLLAAGVGFAWLAENGRLFEGLTLIGLVGASVVASNVLAYREVWLAPSDRMNELAAIGASDLPRPALILEYSPAAARHLLSALDAEAAGEFRWNLIPMYDGHGLRTGAYAEIDDFPISSISPYPTLVLRTDIVGSRPPSTYRVTQHGTYYDVWTFDASAPAIVAHYPLGDHNDPAVTAPCSVVRKAIAAAGLTGRVASAARPAVITVPLDFAALPPGWTRGPTSGSVDASAGGSVQTIFSVPTAGTYQADLGGSVYGSVRVLIDGRETYADHGRLNWTPYANPMPSVNLIAGPHTLTVEYSTSWLPGGGYTPSTLGPAVFSESRANVPVTYTAPQDATSLCNQRLDWVEAVTS